MTTAEALKILNNNKSGRVYTAAEADLLKGFFGKLAVVAKDQIIKQQRRGR